MQGPSPKKSSRRSNKSKVGGGVEVPPSGRYALAAAATADVPDRPPIASTPSSASMTAAEERSSSKYESFFEELKVKKQQEEARKAEAELTKRQQGQVVPGEGVPSINLPPSSSSQYPAVPNKAWGGGNKVTYQGKKYTVREGKRGGLYIMVGGGDKKKKVYLRK